MFFNTRRKTSPLLWQMPKKGIKGILLSTTIFFVAILICSCGDKEEIEIGKVAVSYVDSLYSGDFDGAVLNTAGTSEASPQYREHLALLYRNTVDNNLNEHGALAKTECYGVKEDKEHHCADVYLRLTFADSTKQDILLPMEEHSGQWLMK